MNEKPRPLRIILDPGHGALPGKTLPADPGAVGNGTSESAANLIMALTLKYALVQEGHAVLLTRTDEHRPDWNARTRGMGPCDLYVAIHHDSANGRSMVYYPAGTDDARSLLSPLLSKRFAEELAEVMPDPEFRVMADTTSRFGRLYIRDAWARIAVLWELDPVHVSNASERIRRGQELVHAIRIAQARSDLPRTGMGAVDASR